MFCKAPGIPQVESSIELTSCSITEHHDELNLDKAYDQLEKMKQRVLQMKSMIVREPATTTDEVEAEFEKLADSKNEQLREIQKDTSRSFRQIEVVRNRLAETTKELACLTARIQEAERCTRDLAEKMEKVPQWIEELKHQTGICLERFNELDITLCTYLTYSNHMRPLMVTLEHTSTSRVPLRCYKMQYVGILSRLKKTRELLQNTHDQLMKHTQHINNALSESIPKKFAMLPEFCNLLLDLQRSTVKPKKAAAKVKARSRASIQLATAVSKLKLLQPTNVIKSRYLPPINE
ncbi:uncharacterized protein LOC110191133 [Drosophila serrata]|uniref:uncharacterized protein LOC110191133 n=1 Tax=Drosophila serrata TaxID=7274 RepID=UPI000A1D2BF6|nr:uncharacterized protein LOC110191133 [Drosophila serrata]